MPTFLVQRRQEGPAWDASQPLDRQTGWLEHAAFMDELVERGVITYGGPLPARRVAFAVEAESADAVHELLAHDPWTGTHLVTESVEPWEIRLDTASSVRELVERYNDAWNRQDLDAIHALHHGEIVFDNHTAGERAEGAEAVRKHIATIFRNNPDLRFTTRSLHAAAGFAVCEWTATVTKDGRRLEWDGVDVFPVGDGLIRRKDVYSSSHRPRELGD